MLLGFFLLLGQLVTVFSVVDDPADRGIGIGGDFHQIDAMTPGQLNGVGRGHDPDL